MGEERKPCPIWGVGYLKQRDRAGCDVMSPDGLTVLYQITRADTLFDCCVASDD